MERITLSVDDDLLRAFDALLSGKGYASRSEAFRDMLREKLQAERVGQHDGQHDGQCVGCLSYVYNHHERELARRLTEASHAHHDIALATTHVHLSHDDCLETVILRGSVRAVRRFADRVMAERGVRHGKLHLVPAEIALEGHAHGGGGSDGAPHVHSTPRV